MNGIVTLGECPKTALKHLVECTNSVHSVGRCRAPGGYYRRFAFA